MTEFINRVGGYSPLTGVTNISAVINPAEGMRDLISLAAFLAPRYLVLSRDINGAQYFTSRILRQEEVEKADVLLLLGSNDTMASEKAADLFKMNNRLLIVTSGDGKKGHRTVPRPRCVNTEARIHMQRLLELGVPESNILVEEESNNSRANIVNSQTLLIDAGIPMRRVIIVQTPLAQLRANLIFAKAWSERSEWESMISYPPILELSADMPKDELDFYLLYALREITANMDRCYNRGCPEFGHQMKQSIPDDLVELVYRYFVKLGGMTPPIPAENLLTADNKTSQILLKRLAIFFRKTFERIDEGDSQTA